MDLLTYYNEVRTYSELICKPLETEDYVPQSIYFASPPKWNLAHTTWFFEEFILKSFLLGYKTFHPQYAYLFNSYYEGAGKRTSRDERGTLSRPTVKEIYAYRSYVNKHMNILFESELSNEIISLVHLGLNHEQQHQELFFSDHKYALSRNPLDTVYGDRAYAEEGDLPKQDWIKIEEGIREIGNTKSSFSFDNENPNHKVYINPFVISNRLVTNGEFIEFIEDGAYSNYEFWLEEGWKWVKENGISHPLYWQKNNMEWSQFTLSGLRKINNDELLTHVNFYEAYAYASYKGLRLPTEFEWEAASDLLNWGDRWEWTESAYLPYPGYKTAEGTVGEYNGKFMVNQKVLRGSSVVTPRGHERNTYRNFFHPQMAWQFTGIRLAK
jgi:ergothioneine biosynthesis protein EgtB